MFNVFYNKDDGQIAYIMPNDGREIQENGYDYIVVDEVPQVTPYRQGLQVVDGQLVVNTFELTHEQELNISLIETSEKIQNYKRKLADWDYKTSKYVDGEYTASEWEEIKLQRTIWRDSIRLLERKCDEISKELFKQN